MSFILNYQKKFHDLPDVKVITTESEYSERYLEIPFEKNSRDIWTDYIDIWSADWEQSR